jgi:hypothetical protein
MIVIEHTCNRCKQKNKREVQWISPELFGTKSPEMKSNFWCSNFECKTQLAILLRFEKNQKITIVKELDVMPIIIKDEAFTISARPRTR